MAQNFKAELKNKESVLAYYELCDNPKYCIYIGTNTLSGNLVIQWLDDENPLQGEEQLKKWLKMVEEEESNTNIYTFQSVTKTIPKKYKGEEVLQCEGLTQRFQLHEMVFSSPKQNSQAVTGFDSNKNFIIYEKIFEMMNKQNQMFETKFQEIESNIMAQKNLIENRISGIDDDDEEEEEEEEEEEIYQSGKDKLYGAIGSFIQRENVQNIIEMGAMAIISKIGGTGEKKE